MSVANEIELIEDFCKLIESEENSRNVKKYLPNPQRKKWPTISPLIFAVQKNRRRLVADLLFGYHLDINSTTEYYRNGEWCALAAAVHNGFYDLARYLVHKGADVNIRCQFHQHFTLSFFLFKSFAHSFLC